MRWQRALLSAGLAAAAAVSVGLALAEPSRDPAGPGPGDRLPDLEALAPDKVQTGVAVVKGKKRFRLSFASAAQNVGAGPLIIVAERRSADVKEMTATQLVQRADGSTRSVTGVGALFYVKLPTHQHWHLQPFMRYELRTENGGKLVRPDQKSGFCLGDRFRIATGETSGEFFTNCGPSETELLSLAEGISPGWGDNYEAWRDGQHIDVTGVPAGRYLLVHRVNVPNRLEESSYENNSSSALIELAWPRGENRKPSVVVLATCLDSDRCRAR
jgi:hypothetical protein